MIESAHVGSFFSFGRARDSDDGENGTIGGYELVEGKGQSDGLNKVFRAEKGPNGLLMLELIGQLDREVRERMRGEVRIWDNVKHFNF